MSNAGFVGLGLHLKIHIAYQVHLFQWFRILLKHIYHKISSYQPAENTSQEDLFADDVTNAENFIFRWIQVPKFLNDFSNFSALLNDPIDSFQEDMRTLGLSFCRSNVFSDET